MFQSCNWTPNVIRKPTSIFVPRFPFQQNVFMSFSRLKGSYGKVSAMLSFAASKEGFGITLQVILQP